MRKFAFRLQQVLEYREMAEKWAEDAYREAQARRISEEDGLAETRRQRQNILTSRPSNVQEFRSLESYLERLDDLEQQQAMTLAILEQDEERAKQEWIEKRREAEVMRKLYEREQSEWIAAAEKRAQAEIDEIATQRKRRAA